MLSTATSDFHPRGREENNKYHLTSEISINQQSNLIRHITAMKQLQHK